MAGSGAAGSGTLPSTIGTEGRGVLDADNRERAPMRDYRQARQQGMAQGIVKWFNDAKGYGFIQNEGGEDVFVHYTAIQASGFRTLAEGDRVEFEMARGAKGLQASNVKKL
jgi:cold shock protein